MKRSPEARDDFTADAAVGNVAGESLLTSVLERIEDELDRVLVLAHVALDTPLPKLARELDLAPRELARRIEQTIDMLCKDAVLKAQLGDIWRAGQYEHYEALAVRLNLQHWFCSQCAGLMVQRGIGRPRNTCSNRCRRLLFQANGVSWKDQYEPGTLPAMSSRLAQGRANVSLDSASGREKLQALMRPIEAGLFEGRWDLPSVQSRDRAMILLGFSCPLRITPSDLAALDVTDVVRTPHGLEVRLFKRAARTTQFVMVPMSENPKLCSVSAMAAWRSLMVRRGRTIGPLFVRPDDGGTIPLRSRRLGGQAIAKVVNQTLWLVSRTRAAEISASTLFPDFLEQLRVELPAQ
ncbi:MAG: hypothetical protein ACRDNF_25175 [Streptosporangiaceae bacterium]